jgi:hypothetical protein
VDQLTFLLNRKVAMIAASRPALLAAIRRHYAPPRSDSDADVDMLSECGDEEEAASSEVAVAKPRSKAGALARYLGKSGIEFKKGMHGLEETSKQVAAAPGKDTTQALGESGMFFHVVEEGQRVLVRHKDGTGPGVSADGALHRAPRAACAGVVEQWHCAGSLAR